jgi:hypothetical protein
MKVNRFATAAVVAATAVLALTACGPDEVNGAAGAPSSAAAGTGSSAPSTGAAPTAQPIGGGSTAKPVKPTRTPKPTATKSSGASPSSDCTAQAAANLNGAIVVQATDNGYATHIWMKAQPAKFVCGPDVPDDGYYEGYGTPAVYSFSNDVKTTLLNNVQPQSVDLDTFMKHQDACLHNPDSVTMPYHCYGNKYVITVNGQNVITSIDELYHP